MLMTSCKFVFLVCEMLKSLCASLDKSVAGLTTCGCGKGCVTG